MSFLADLKIDKTFIMKFIRFCIVGAISFFINAGFTFIFYNFLMLDLMFSTMIALIITQFFQFPMSKEFAFKYEHKTKAKQFLYFLGTRFASMLIITIVTDLGTKMLGIPWILAQLAGVGIGMIFNFITANWFVFMEPVTLQEQEIKEKQMKYLTYTLLFLVSLMIGSIILTLDPVIFSDDGVTWYLEAHNIIAHQGIPYFKWWHTPLYPYFIAIISILFNDNMTFLRIFQIIINSITVCVIFAAINLKKERKVALLGSILYMTSYIGLLSTYEVHQENLAGLLIAVCFYFFFRYEKERKSFWIWCAALFLGLAFFTKEQAIVFLGIYVIYEVFWIKPKKLDLLICAGILTIFFGAFIIVQYLQDWFIIINYLGVGGAGNDTFLSRGGIIEIEKLLTALSVDLIPFIFGFIYIIILFIRFVKKRKITTEETLAVIVIVFLIFFLVSRGGIIHFSFVIFPVEYIASTGFFEMVNLSKKNVPKLAQLVEKNERKFIFIALMISFSIHLFLFIPNIFIIRNLNHEKIVIYQDIADIVQENVTYSENPDGLGLFITNYYSPYSWYNAYERNNFEWWNPNDVFRLQNMQNITDRGLIYFVYENLTSNGDFFDEIAINGTLTVVETYTYRSQTIWWIPAVEGTVILYEIL